MMQTLISFVIFLTFGAICSFVAKQKGRDPVAWYILGMLFCLLALVVLFLLPPLPSQAEDIEENEDQKLSGLKPGGQTEPLYTQNEWFYISEEKRAQGPVGFELLKKMWQEGRLSSNSFLWTEGMNQWKRVKELKGMEDALSPSSFLDYSTLESSI
jgi:GYF domain 2